MSGLAVSSSVPALGRVGQGPQRFTGVIEAVEASQCPVGHVEFTMARAQGIRGGHVPPAVLSPDPDLRTVPRHPPDYTRDYGKWMVECDTEKPDTTLTSRAHICPVIDLATGDAYLRAKPEDLARNDFFEASTIIMFHLIARAVSQIGNHDKIGRFSASNIVDGTVVLSIGGTIQAAIVVKDHHLTTTREIPEHYSAIMEFADIKLARDIFDGKASTLGCVGNGLISMRGNLSMLDNINRILDRVALYLA